MRRRTRRQLKWTMLAPLAALTAALAAGLFDRLPAARKFREYVLWDRVLLPVTLVLTSPRPEPEAGRLPVYDLQIKPEYVEQLDADLPSYRLPPSAQEYHPAVFRHEGIRYRVQARYRGDNAWHFNPPQKSWRLKFRKTDRFQNQRLVNLINPKSQSTLMVPMAVALAERLGLLTPRCQPVHTIINRQYRGVALDVEQVDAYFLINRDLAEGSLYYGEAARLWDDPNAWTCRMLCPVPGRGDHEPLERLLAAVQAEDPTTCRHRLERIIDLDEWLTLYCHSLISGDTHRDDIHNQKLYFDAIRGRFRFILWDPLGYDGRPHRFSGPQVSLDHVFNELNGRLLQMPEMVERKNRRLWELLHGAGSEAAELAELERLYALVRADIHADRHKDFNMAAPVRLYSAGQFEWAVEQHRQWIRRRHEFLRSSLETTAVSLRRAGPSQSSWPHRHEQVVETLVLHNGGTTGVRLAQMHFRGDTQGARTWRLYHDGNDNARLDSGDRLLAEAAPAPVVQWTSKASLLPARRRAPAEVASLSHPDYQVLPVPARHRLFIAAEMPAGTAPSAPVHIEPNELVVTNTVTGTVAAVDWSNDDPAGAVAGRLLSGEAAATHTVQWGPGVIEIARDVILNADTELVVAPGTTVELAAGVSVVCRGRVQAQGRPDAPIVVRGRDADKPWGAWALQGAAADGSRFTHCTFTGGSEAYVDGVFYSGMFSAYAAAVCLEDCRFTDARADDGVNIKYGSASVLRRCHFEDNSADAIDLDFCAGLVTQCTIANSGNDGLDLGAASARVEDSVVRHCGDKGISVGENARPEIRRCRLLDNHVGLAAKDMARPVVQQCEFRGNDVAVACHQKKGKFGPAEAVLQDCTLVANAACFAADINSRLSVHGCRLPADACIAPLPADLAPFAPAYTRVVRSCADPLMDIHDNEYTTAGGAAGGAAPGETYACQTP